MKDVHQHYHIEDSYITVKNDEVTSFIGPDATHLFQAKCIVMSFRAIKNGFRLTRGATPTRMFKLASQYTGQKYKRGEYDRAMADMQVWISAMESALPVIEEK